MDRLHAPAGRTLAVVVAALFLIFIASIACAQDASTGAIRGTVADKTGAVIPEALVVASNMATNVERSVLTDGQGDFAIQMLTPGQYRVRVTAPGQRSSGRM
jgi:Carboxypeptidase regulatory-like domain